jgi:tyrosinase
MVKVLTRKGVHALRGPWHPVLRAYEQAIAVMKSRPARDATSLAYQAAVHGVGAPTAPPPDKFRSQCQHNCWYFLPWHRWYLHYFEQIVRSILTELVASDQFVGRKDIASSWALPYWNYAKPGFDKLPVEFASPKRWDGKPNALFDPSRLPDVNGRVAGVDPRLAVPGTGVLQLPFSSTSTRVATFGGGASGWHHFREPGATTGGLEGTPHNDVHGFVGGNMWDFATAGLDPVFWLHHCNMDRYWEVRGHGSDPAGWASTKFDFRDATRTAVKVTSNGCVESVGQLGYRYDDTDEPTPPTRGLDVRRSRRAAMAEQEEPSDLEPEVVGTSDPVELHGASVGTAVAVRAVSPQFRTTRGGEAEPRRVYLTVDDITGATNPGISYGVYVGGAADDRMAGAISFFGIEATTEGGHALAYTFDITDIVAALRDAGAWDPADVAVSFEPIGPTTDDNRASSRLENVAPVSVGSVSIAYQ